MTETYSSNPIADDIDDTFDSRTDRLDREADAILADAEARTFARTSSLRQAVRSDLDHGRQWARERAERSRAVIQEEPLRAALYAVGAGVLIGLLLRR